MSPVAFHDVSNKDMSNTFYKTVVAILDLLYFCMNSKIIVIKERGNKDFDRIVVNLWTNLGDISI